MKGNNRNILGTLLIVGGGFMMLQTMGVIQGSFGSIFWGIVLGALGIIFMSFYQSDKSQWWWQIPSYVLLGISTGIILNLFAWIPDSISDSFFTLGISLAFIMVYKNNNSFWWAIIPAGILGTITLMELVGGLNLYQFEDSILFFGFSATFLALTRLPAVRKDSGNFQWPYIPAGVFFILAMVETFENTNLWQYIGPGLAILLGVILLIRSVKSNDAQDPHKEY